MRFDFDTPEQLADFLKSRDACTVDWIISNKCKTMEQAWDACDVLPWLRWLLLDGGLLPDAELNALRARVWPTLRDKYGMQHDTYCITVLGHHAIDAAAFKAALGNPFRE